MKNLKITLSIFLIVIITSTAFLPCLKNGFVNWDDDKYVTQNPVIKNFSFENIKQIFKGFFVCNYQPVTMLSYLFEYQIFRLNPFGYHVINLILHALNCLIVFWLIYLLTRRISVSLITAILFGIHPLHVESVAWISERKDVLYGLFFLASIVSYCYYRRQGRVGKYYYASLILFSLSLLSKTMAITLPLVLFLIDYFLEERPDKSLLLDKIPFFVLSLAFGIIGIWGQYSGGAIRDESLVNLLNKLSICSYGIIFYLNKIFVPIRLSCIYPRPEIKDIPVFIYSMLTVIVLFIAVVFSHKHTRKVVFGSVFFLINILPVLQFIPIGDTIVADRYVYMASLGLFYVFAEGLFWLYMRSKRIKYSYFWKYLILAIFIAIAGIFVSLTWKRCRVWKDALSLWSDVLNNYPANFATAYNNRGAALLAGKKYDEAFADIITALKIDPEFYEAYFNLGSLYGEKGKYEEAIGFVKRTLQINPDYTAAYDLLIDLCVKSGKHIEIVDACKRKISISPDDADAYIKLCCAYGKLGHYRDAIVSGEKAVALDPRSGLAHSNLAAAYFYTGSYDLAIKNCDQAIALGFPVPSEFINELRPYRK